MGEPVRKITTVGNNGQISIGKDMAGQEVQIEKWPDGRITITPGMFVPAHQATFFTPEAADRLKDFEKWAAEHPAEESDLDAVKAKLRARRAKKA